MRKSRGDWLEMGLRTLVRDGLAGLTIVHLAHRLRLTKGSFYYHFTKVADYKSQLIAYWADQCLSTAATLPEDPVAGLDLLDAVMDGDFIPANGPEVAIRAWAQQDKEVRAYVERVDEARRPFVFHIFVSLKGDVIQAQRMADQLFAMLIGSIMALPRYTPERVSVLYAEFKRAYGLTHL